MRAAGRWRRIRARAAVGAPIALHERGVSDEQGVALSNWAAKSAASLRAVPIARRSPDVLLARSNLNRYAGNIAGHGRDQDPYPQPSVVTLANASNQAGEIEVSACGRDHHARRSPYHRCGALLVPALSASWTDTYPTSYGVSGAATCMNNTQGPAFATSFTNFSCAAVLLAA